MILSQRPVYVRRRCRRQYQSLGSFKGRRPATGFQYPTGVSATSERNDSQWLFDLKFTKEFNLGRGLNMQVSAEIFNVFNDGTYFVYNDDAEAGFQINGVDGARLEFGRQWQLGMRLSF